MTGAVWMHVLIYTLEFPPYHGGAGTYCHELARGLQRMGVQVSVLTRRYGEDDKLVDRILPFDVIRETVVWHPERDARTLAHAAKKLRPDVMLVGDYGAQLAVAHSRRAMRLAYAVTLHRAEIPRQLGAAPCWRDYIRGRRAKGLYRRAQRIIAVSEDTRRLLLRCLPGVQDKVDVITHGVDVDRFSPLPAEGASRLRSELGLDDRKIILTLSRLVPHKHQDVLIRALPRIRSEVPDVFVLIAGDGPEREHLMNLAREYDLAEHVGFVGSVSESQKPDYYRLCDLFVLVSQGEGFGLVYLEANACGKPALGANSGGTPDAISAGFSGELARPGDVGDAAERIIRLLKDDGYRQVLGEQGRQRVLEGFTLRHMAERTLRALTVAVQS
jgi:phosphatidylinositol alpha-1,6-mannosyltransferase